MNKRVPLLLSLLGVILLAASIAYWILQLYQPPQRPIAAVPVAQMPDPAIDAAASLFGGQIAVASATNYQLTGVVAGPSNSVAIIVAEGSPPKALVVGKELSPGITLAEVHARYVMLSDNGVMKRIDLAPDTKGAAPMGGAPSDNPPPPMSNVNNGATPIMPPPANAPTGNVVAEPPMAPGAVQQQMPVNPTDAGAQQQNPNVAPVNNPNNPNSQNNPNAVNPANQAPAPVQMPPPTRAVNPNGVAPAVR
jgi:general secretion pathway protein C